MHRDLTKHFTDMEIDLTGIHLENKRFSLRFFENPSPYLIESVKNFGIISPPILYPFDNMYQVLDGFLRLKAAHICGLKRVPCKVYKRPVNKREMAFFVISIFLSNRTPHILDQATILLRLSDLLGEACVTKEILPLLGHPSSRKLRERLIPLAGIGEKLGRALLAGIINQDMALRLMALESVEREQIGSLFIHFGFSQSKQFEILENLLDISARDNQSLLDVLKEMGWDERHQEEIKENKGVAGERIRNRIKKRRNPCVSRLENAWKIHLNALHLPQGISLNPPPYFEGSTFSLSFTFKNQKEFQKKIAELKDLGESDALEKIFPK